MNFNIGFSEKIIFLGVEDFVDIFWGSSQNCTIFRDNYYAFLSLFLRPRYRILAIFCGVAKVSNIFLGSLKFLILWGGGWTVDAGPEPTYEEK